MGQVEKNEQKTEQLLEILDRHKGEKVIVYTHIKAREYGTREMNKVFQEKGFNCHYFDADMQDAEKLSILEKFENGEIKIVFATSAFGMGIDIPDIRAVVHYLVPESIEQYYQEVGRAGRDNKPAFGYLLYSETNFKVRRDLIKKSLLKPERIREIFDSAIMATYKTNSTRKLKKPIVEKDVSGKIYSLSKTDVREDNSEMIIFLFLLADSVIKFHGKGIEFFDCFESSKPSKMYDLMEEASVQGMVKRIAKKLNKSIEQISNDIFIMFNQDEIKLIKKPINVLFYTVEKDLTEQLIEEIHETLKIRMENRLLNFEKLVAFIESKSDPIKTIAEHLGTPYL